MLIGILSKKKLRTLNADCCVECKKVGVGPELMV